MRHGHVINEWHEHISSLTQQQQLWTKWMDIAFLLLLLRFCFLVAEQQKRTNPKIEKAIRKKANGTRYTERRREGGWEKQEKWRKQSNDHRKILQNRSILFRSININASRAIRLDFNRNTFNDKLSYSIWPVVLLSLINKYIEYTHEICFLPQHNITRW